MPGRKISRANMQRIQQIADHAHAMGAKGPEPDRSPLGKADMSLGDQIQAVAMAVHGGGMEMSSPYVEEVFDSYVILCAGESYYKAAYSTAEDGSVTLSARDAWVEVEEVWQEKQASAKAGLPLDIEQSDATPYASLKAVGDRLIEVKVAYGGHRNGKDSHGEYFSPNTDFDPENFPAPPAALLPRL